MELPPGPGTTSTAVVESRVVPGTAFGSCLARGYARDENASLVHTVLSGRVPGLAQTTLTNATGQILFRGLRRGFIGLPILQPQALADLPDADLERLVSELVMVKHQGESPENHRRKVAEHCRRIRSDDCEAVWAEWVVRGEASERMAKESAVAALCSDPDELQRAMGGETADIKLFDVSLLTRNDFTPWLSHHLKQIWTLVPLRSLQLQSPDRALCQISAKASSREFALCVEDQGHDSLIHHGLTVEVVQLLGGMGSREPGATCWPGSMSCVPAPRNWAVNSPRAPRSRFVPCRPAPWIKLAGCRPGTGSTPCRPRCRASTGRRAPSSRRGGNSRTCGANTTGGQPATRPTERPHGWPWSLT